MRYHSLKMEEINKIIKELWNNTYRGHGKLYCRIGGVMVGKLTFSAVDHGFKPRSDHTKVYKISICFFSAKRSVLRSKSED